jgi:hypothetical protein
MPVRAGAIRIQVPGQPSASQPKAFLFQLIDLATNVAAPVLVVQGTENPLLNDKLRMLFDATETAISRRAMDFFKSVIDGAKHKS